MGKRKFSDRVYTTLLWEFMQFAKQRVWDTSFAEQTLKVLEQTGELNAAETRRMLKRDEVLKALEAGASGLFVDFILENQEILAEGSLLKWVEEKQKNYPFS